MKFGQTVSAINDIAGRILRLLAEAPSDEQSDGGRPQLDGSELMGDYNFRTGRMDCGADPYGWYGDND